MMANVLPKGLARRFIGFAVAGATGFVVDASVLTGLMAFTPLGPYSARIFAIGAAMFATWMINRTMTFGKSDRHVVREGARYGAVAITGAVLNYAIYSGLLLAAPNLFTPLGALVIAVGFVTVFSYVGYSRFVFSRG